MLWRGDAEVKMNELEVLPRESCLEEPWPMRAGYLATPTLELYTQLYTAALSWSRLRLHFRAAFS